MRRSGCIADEFAGIGELGLAEAGIDWCAYSPLWLPTPRAMGAGKTGRWKIIRCKCELT